jgi:hypothetical protein
VTAIPFLVLAWGRTTLDRWHGRVRQAAARRHVVLAVSLLVVALVFAVVRNTPAGAWLAP